MKILQDVLACAFMGIGVLVCVWVVDEVCSGFVPLFSGVPLWGKPAAIR